MGIPSCHHGFLIGVTLSLALIGFLFGLLQSSKYQGPATGPRLGVCITGQLSRLELSVKLAAIVAPFSEVFNTIDLVFVLDMDVARSFSTNTKSGAVGGNGLYRNESDILRAVERAGIQTLGSVRVVDYQQPLAPVIHPVYLSILDKVGPEWSAERRRNRAGNHIRIFGSLAECVAPLTDNELDRGGSKYNAILRVRDDLMSWGKVNGRAMYGKLKKLEKREHRPVLLSPRCASWGGINDKFQLMGRDAGMAFMGGLLKSLYLYFDQVVTADVQEARREKFNPEQFLARAANALGVVTEKLKDEDVPVGVGTLVYKVAKPAKPDGAVAEPILHFCAKGLDKSCGSWGNITKTDVCQPYDRYLNMAGLPARDAAGITP